jgi:tellurite resistance protein TerC
MGHHSVWVWVIFHVFVLVMLALDLGVFHRKQHVVHVKEALGWTAVWIVVALLFCVTLLFWSAELGLLAVDRAGQPMSESRTAIDFLTAYLTEKSLSMDNVFVFLLIFRYFAIPAQHQHKALFWGILGALVMRLTFILAGVALLSHFRWVAYLFGAILLYTGLKLWNHSGTEVHPDRNPVLRLFKKIMPVRGDDTSGKFMVKCNGQRFATPLLVALVAIETTDVLFAVDSVPAVLSITPDVFIAYSSNVFAILGLRALYFALAGIMPLFKDLHYGLSFILIFVGGKMVAHELMEDLAIGHWPSWMHWVSLSVVGGTLVLSILTSVIRHRGELNLDGASPGSGGNPA